MCKKTNYHSCNVRMDKCMRRGIGSLNRLFSPGFKTIASCCGHGKYPMSIVIEYKSGDTNPFPFELFTGKVIPRRKQFYKRDEKGFYFIPEVSNTKTKNA